MKLNFTNEEYKNRAKESVCYSRVETNRTTADAFMLLIRGVSMEELSNLCKKIQSVFALKLNRELSLENCYDIVQGKIEGIDELVKQMEGKSSAELILELAYECVEVDGQYLGEKTVNDGKINTSSWISHSLYEAKAAKKLAQKCGLNPEKAGVFAMIHDYGRKYIHDFSHVIKGFEALVEEGWEAEARACLTHSFINAGRCANCDPAEDGFYIDESGMPAWESSEPVDDMAEVLQGMKYDEYDTILNIADLIATDKGITDPYTRVLDVATRKKPDVRNRAYFLAEFTNKLLEVMKSGRPKSSALSSIEEADEQLQKVSKIFYRYLYSEKEHLNKDEKSEIENDD